MSELNHTPGPWEIRRTGHEKKDFSIFKEGIPSSAGCIAKLHYREGREHVVLHNARLISAAPYLLDVLIELESMEHSLFAWQPEEKREAWSRARAAIAKATGSGS